MRAVEVISPGPLTTVQDWPGRTGLWEVGVPPSGPMDARSFRLGNRLVGNPEGAAGLEVTLSGPRLRFASPATVAVTGAPLPVKLDGTIVPLWRALDVPAGAELGLGTIRGAGLRAYVLIAGGIDAAAELGSRASFPAAGLGRPALRAGDTLALGESWSAPAAPFDDERLESSTTLRVVAGPHGAPDFLTTEGLAELFAATWTVHHHSDRSGIRLVGPQPGWARADGAEAGLHPSNILDSAYGVGTVMLAGDVAVIVGVDGPSLGGFVAVAQVIEADRWRLGQLRAGHTVTLEVVGPAAAARLRRAAEAEIAGAVAAGPVARAGPERGASLLDRALDGAHGPLRYRVAGERALLVEFGEQRLDLRSRVRAHTLRDALDGEGLPGLLDVTPGVRSLHIQFDADRLSAGALAAALAGLEAQTPPPEAVTIPGRAVYLPLAWRHSQAMRAIEHYQAVVRADAPWCPDNIEFIRRINGLPDEAAVREIVFGASYLVVGLGDVYLGAPVAVPLDPRHRLVTTKYTPNRTWTPANAVGIGGAFLCVYGIEGPGGYQLVGRTVPIWDAREQPPWRLRHFDQLRFEAAAEPELEELRASSQAGTWRPRVEPADFVLADHLAWVAARGPSIDAFTSRREAAFARERAAWQAAAEEAA